MLSKISRLMSSTYNVPSGALTRLTGRNQRSDDRTNSVFASARSDLNVTPSGRQRAAMNQVILRVRYENIPVVFRRVRASAVDRHARCGIDDMMAGAW